MKVKDILKGLFGSGSTSKGGKRKSTSSKNRSSKSKSVKSSKTKRTSDVRKIYKTTDGYFTGNDKIKKPRRVAVVDQRKDDGALAVVKIYSKKGKKGDMYIKGLTLKEEKHSSLTEDSIVGNQVHIGIKGKDKKYKPIFTRDLTATQDSLTAKEHNVIAKKAGGNTKKNRKTNREKIRKWKKHFKN